MTSDRRIEISWAFTCDSANALPDSRVERLVEFILDSENVNWKVVGIIFGSHDLVRDLNNNYLQHDYNTDVLSFLIDDSDEGIEAEVYVDVETAIERHSELGTTLEKELERYVAHGVLHVAGHDDSSVDGKNAMRLLEDKYLQALNR